MCPYKSSIDWYKWRIVILVIGNDIVDLQQNTPHPRFADRITSSQEKIEHRLHTSRKIWELWAIKEASYKAFMQMFGRLSGNPKLYEVSQDLRQVTFNGHTLEASLYSEADYTFAQVFSKKSRARFVIGKIEKDNESKAVRTLCASLFDDVGTIQKSELGIPSFVTNQKSYPISLSHHNRYMAASKAIG